MFNQICYAHCFMDPITRHHFSQADNISLQPCQWLTDNVINFFATRDVLSLDSMVLFDAFNYTQWQRDPAEIKNWKQNNIDQHKSGSFLDIKKHFQLGLITDPGMESCRQMLFDSLIGAKGMTSNRIQLSNYANYLVWQSFNDAITVLPKHSDPVATTQPNGYDCGVFTIMNIENDVVMDVDLLLGNQNSGLDLTHWFIRCQAQMHFLNYMHAVTQQYI
jgi:Ulp1 family protease